MTEPTVCAAACSSPAAYCDNCDLRVGLEGLHVVEVVHDEEHLRVRVVRVVRVVRNWACLEPACPVWVFTEQDEQVARARGLLTVRAC